MVGRTPLLSLNKLAKQCKSKARILGKCEFYNPLFSVKDRVALKMIEAAEAGGEINDRFCGSDQRQHGYRSGGNVCGQGL